LRRPRMPRLPVAILLLWLLAAIVVGAFWRGGHW
jgi:hypothetical protein